MSTCFQYRVPFKVVAKALFELMSDCFSHKAVRPEPVEGHGHDTFRCSCWRHS
jgi:hypothetical protein